MFVTYTGPTNERGEAHGRGVKEYADGSRYEGQWKDGKKHGHGFVFSSKHFDEGPDTDFRWRIGAEFKEGHLDGERMLTKVTIGDGPKAFETTWENGLLVAIEDLRIPEEEATPALEKIREEIEQMRESDSDEVEGPN